MGAWGTGLFSDDIALDVRADYREIVEDGVDDEAAYEQMCEKYEDTLADTDYAPVFWLAFAVSQSQLGRLHPEVKRHALAVIDSGADLARWKDADNTVVRERRRTLERVRRRLEGPQPERKTLRRKRPQTTDLQPGDVVAGRTPRGNYVLVRVARIDQNRTGAFAIVRWLWWGRPELPSDVEAVPDSTAEGLMHVQGQYKKAGFSKLGRVGPRPGDDERVYAYTRWDALAR